VSGFDCIGNVTHQTLADRHLSLDHRFRKIVPLDTFIRKFLLKCRYINICALLWKHRSEEFFALGRGMYLQFNFVVLRVEHVHTLLKRAASHFASWVRWVEGMR